MSTSKGKCAVSGGALSCGSGVASASTFSAVSSFFVSLCVVGEGLIGGQVASGSQLLLAFGGSTAWTSDGTPSGTVQETIFTGSGHAVDYTIAIVSA